MRTIETGPAGRCEGFLTSEGQPEPVACEEIATFLVSDEEAPATDYGRHTWLCRTCVDPHLEAMPA